MGPCHRVIVAFAAVVAAMFKAVYRVWMAAIINTYVSGGSSMDHEFDKLNQSLDQATDTIQQ